MKQLRVIRDSEPSPLDFLPIFKIFQLLEIYSYHLTNYYYKYHQRFLHHVSGQRRIPRGGELVVSSFAGSIPKQDQVYDIVRLIPTSRVTSYGIHLILFFV